MALSKLTKVQTLGIGSNIEVVGVITTGQFKSGTSNLHSTGVDLTNLNVSGIATIGGNLSIGGTLTYQDVTNIDSVGLITARAGVNVSGGQLDVGSNIKLGNAGVITATSFVGSGSQLTGISGVSVANQADNRLITATGTTDALNGEANLTYNGSILHNQISAGARNDFSTSADGLIIEKGGNTGLSIDPGSSGIANIYFPNESNHSIASISHNNSNGEFRIRGEDHIILSTNSNTERLRIDSSGRLHIATGGSTTNVSGNADDIIIGNTSTSNETGISMFSTSTSGIRFNDASGTDAAIEYSHSARELRFNSAGANRLIFGVNASNSPVFSLGSGHYSGDSNNHNQGDRASVKVGGYLHLESATGAGHNSRAGLGYNCYFSSAENFNCGTKSPNGGDNRPAAYGMAYGNHYFYCDASNTAHSAQAQLTMSRRMEINRSGAVMIPNQPIASLSASGATDVSNEILTSSNFYNYTWVNQGSHFNASNGRFTCPVAGIYRIYFRASEQDTTSTNVRLRKNGNTINEAYTKSGNHSVSSEAIVSCSANDYLEIQANRLKANSGIQHKQVTFQLLH